MPILREPEAPPRGADHRGPRAADLVQEVRQGDRGGHIERPVPYEPEPGAIQAGLNQAPAFAMFDYKSPRWTRLRASVLREAGYQCQWSRRYGRRVQASHVHHIWPAEDFPQYAFCRWNLIALSQEAHNAMHDRTTGKLTAAGEALRRKTIPPSLGFQKNGPA